MASVLTGIVSRLEEYLMKVASGAGIEDGYSAEESPSPARPKDGESLPQALLRVRGEIVRLRSELAQVQNAPPPVDEIKAQLRAYVETLAAQGRPSFRITASGKLTFHAADIV